MNGLNAVSGTAGLALEPACVPVGPAGMAGAAAEAMETVSRLTMGPLSRDSVEWEQPSDLSRLVVELRCVVGALPQVLEQLARCPEAVQRLAWALTDLYGGHALIEPGTLELRHDPSVQRCRHRW